MRRTFSVHIGDIYIYVIRISYFDFQNILLRIFFLLSRVEKSIPNIMGAYSYTYIIFFSILVVKYFSRIFHPLGGANSIILFYTISLLVRDIRYSFKKK